VRTRITALIASAMLAAPALAGAAPVRSETGRDEVPPTLGWIGAESRPDGKPTTLMQVIPDVAPAAAQAHYIVYLNRRGGTYSPGGNDARINKSSIARQVVSVPAFGGSEGGWSQVMSCVTQVFAPFDIEITDTDPGSQPHIEAVVGGSPDVLGLDPTVGGVSPFTPSCGVITNSIVYIFSDIYRDDYETVCEVVAQEVAHSFGLDHEYLPSDPMTYLDYNGLKTFQDVTTPCGEFGPRPCGLPNAPVCRQTQNSFQLLRERVGIGDPPPKVAIASPANGATVPPDFTLSASATDDQGITKAELYVDGQLLDTVTDAPYLLTVSGLVEGAHQIAVRAYDAKNTGSATINVTVQLGAPAPEPVTDPGGNGADGSTIVGGCTAGGGEGGVLLAVAIFFLASRGRNGRRARRASRPLRFAPLPRRRPR